MSMLKDIKNIIIFIMSLLIIILLSFGIWLYNKNENKEPVINECIVNEEIDDTSDLIYVDIKGAVKKPGVYQVKSNSIVNDVIKLAGGLTSGATTKNINLSQKITNEMVIYIFKKSELTTTKESIKCDTKCDTKCEPKIIEVNNCITTTTSINNESNENSLININTASKEELMNLTGIGESKADAIIEYRNKNKFIKIEDIMNVSGIGEAAFAKIKDNITV